ncbi:MAG: 50S ribosomal protein L19 [Candidatus Lernaella stagnicola]|nr:50S ribosomal protein L19 [Candidatus Lernaella stagnicola]
MDVIASFEKSQTRSDLPEFNIGDVVRVNLRIREGEKERLQPFEGVVIAKRNAGSRSSFTVRKVSYGIGVERVIPCFSPALHGLVVVRRGDVRRSKLYYLRNLRGKAARIKEKRDW